MGIFDSKSTTSSRTTTQNAAFSEIGGSASSLNLDVQGGKKGTTTTNVNVLDGGAIGQAFTFAAGAQSEALKQVELAGSRAAGMAKESLAAVSENARSETENVTLTAIKWGAVAAVALAAFGFFRR